MKKIIFLFLMTITLLAFTGCENLPTMGGTSKSPMSQERIATAVDVNEEIFGVGSATVTESGQGVAKMRANKIAREDLQKKLLKETKTILKAYLIEIDFYSKNISEKVISDLSEYITNILLNDATEKDSWIENEEIYVVLAINRNEIPEKTRDTFVAHIDSIIKKLETLKTNILEIPLENSATVEAPTKTEAETTTEVVTPPAEEKVEFQDDEAIDVQL